MTWKTNKYWQNQGKTSQENGTQENSPNLLLDRYLAIRCVYWSNEVWSTEYIVARFMVVIFWTIHLNTTSGWLKILFKYFEIISHFLFTDDVNGVCALCIEHKWLKTKHDLSSKLTANALPNACPRKFRLYDIFDMPPANETKTKAQNRCEKLMKSNSITVGFAFDIWV